MKFLIKTGKMEVKMIKKIIIVFILVTSLCLFTNTTIAARCLVWKTLTKMCNLCGGDGLEHSGARIGRAPSEWKNKHKCRKCNGLGISTYRKCVKWASSKPADVKQK